MDMIGGAKELARRIEARQPSVRVQDCDGREIKVGTRVRYGGEHDATVVALSDPDIVETEDEYGRERVTGLAVYIRVRFSGDAEPVLALDPTATLNTDAELETTVRATDITSYHFGPEGPIGDLDQTFEEPGDLEVIA